MKRLGGIILNDLSGGLNTRDGAGAIADNEYSDAQNVFLIGGGFSKRKGYSRYFNTQRIDAANYGLGIEQAGFTSGSQIIGVAGTKIAVKGTSSWTDITGSVTLTAGHVCMFTMINNVLVCVNGTNPAWYYTGSGNATTFSGENIPTAPTTCETFQGRLFLTTGRYLWWSEYMGNWNQPFKSSSYQPFEGTIVASKVLGSTNSAYMYVFTDNSITACIFDSTISEQVGGDGVFRFEKISNQHGCIAGHSVQECVTKTGDLVLIWADDDGLKAISGENKIVKLTDKIQKTWDNLNAACLQNAIGVFYKPRNWYLLFCCNGTSMTHDTVIVYDIEKWCVVGVFDWAVSAAGIVSINGIDRLIGSDYSGYWNIYDDTESDNGEAIAAYLTTKAYDGGLPTYEKVFRSLTLQYSSLGLYTINMIVYYDHRKKYYEASIETKASGATIPFVLGTSRLGASGQAAIQSVGLKGRGRIIQFKIFNNASSEPFEIHSIACSHSAGRMVLFR